MEKDLVLKILSLKSVDSTQSYLKQLLHLKKVEAPYAVVAEEQTAGLGSRNNSWHGYKGNLFLSFAIPIKELPSDLKLESASIYFAYILQEVLYSLGSEVWLKWPNDFYILDQKIGGMITNIVGENLVCGVGLNLLFAPEGFRTLDIKVSADRLLQLYFTKIEKKVLWKQVFSKYKLEFYRNQNYFTHENNLRISLAKAELLDDGSIEVNGKRMYSLR